MCGFVGFVNNEADKIKNEQTIHDMADKIIHRGPDSDGYHVDDDVSLGFRRLSIMDLEGGDQPIYNEDGTCVLVFNGEIYNHNELREELKAKGHVFKTHTDSEVVLHGVEEYGPSFAERLRGMFAFLVWNTKTKTLIGARDIFGIKPMFYYYDEKSLLFASEIKAFLAHPDFVKELNRERIPDYLCFEYIPSNETMVKNVYKIKPGTYFEYKDGKMNFSEYFRFEYNIDNSKSLEEWENIIVDTFRDSAHRHSLADVEVGCFLSSGVDTSYAVIKQSK